MSTKDIPESPNAAPLLGLGSSEWLGPLVEQAGWAVEMHGQCVLFANNAEKASGRSPGAKTRVFTERQVLEMLAAERERCASRCEDAAKQKLRVYGQTNDLEMLHEATALAVMARELRA